MGGGGSRGRASKRTPTRAYENGELVSGVHGHDSMDNEVLDVYIYGDGGKIGRELAAGVPRRRYWALSLTW